MEEPIGEQCFMLLSATRSVFKVAINKTAEERKEGEEEEEGAGG